jgi:glyoxylase-like metal-dependent hydrolase (beta-lactamase superfamily II)
MKLTPIIASRFRLDGGTMFGIVPRAIWQRLITPDDANRIAQNLNTWLVELDDGRKGLLDLGYGNPSWFSEKERQINDLDDRWLLTDRLGAMDVQRHAIEFVILSHLHWDHAGGVAHCQEDDLAVTFPNAVHFVHCVEWTDATAGNPLLHRAYPEATIRPMQQMNSQSIHLVEDDDTEILPGIRMIRTGGHTRGHCCIVFEADTIEVVHPQADRLPGFRKAVYAADVCPMQHHLRMAYVMSYDNFPLDTRQWKLNWLPKVASSGDLLMFIHDPDCFGATILPDDRREFIVAEVLSTDVC